jgi:hypothetical protein
VVLDDVAKTTRCYISEDDFDQNHPLRMKSDLWMTAMPFAT